MADERLDGQGPSPTPRRVDPCACDPARGTGVDGCYCRDDDGTASHGGCEIERSELFGRGFPRAVRKG